MSTHRHARLEELIVHCAQAFVARDAIGPAGHLVTITRAALDEDNKRVTLFFSVLPKKGAPEALVAAKRARSDFRIYLMEHARIHPVPTIDFALDEGEENRQRVDALMRK